MFPYSQERVNENRAGKEEITSKQIWYIFKLSGERNDKDEFLNSIMDSIPGGLDIEDLSKGQAMFVIKCLLGEIRPTLRAVDPPSALAGSGNSENSAGN